MSIRGRTVADVPSENLSSNPTAGHSIQRALRPTDALLGRETVTSEMDTPTDEGIDDIVGDLLHVAWFNQYQLTVLIPLVTAVRSSDDTVRNVIATAGDFGVSDASAIGAAATLVSVTKDGDEKAIAACLSTMLGCFSDDELSKGAASLTAALTVTIADALGIDPVQAQNEMAAAASVAAAPRLTPRMRRHLSRPARRSARRDTTSCTAMQIIS